MARRAFLLARNTGRLRHCAEYDAQGRLTHSDLWLMCDCLGRVLEFDQVEVAHPDASHDDITAQLEAVTSVCSCEDTFVFYFAGHSLGNAGLQLVIKDPPSKRSNWMAADTVLGFLKDCPALCKLLILDSCESGKSAIGMLPDPGANIRVLTATDGVLNAQERSQLNAGIFTHHLHLALTEPRLRHAGTNGVLDDDGNLCLERVHRWLRSEVPGYAKEGEPEVPKPRLYGDAGREIVFATGLEPHLRRPFSQVELASLLALLGDARLPAKQLEHDYEDVLVKSGLSGGYYGESPPRYADAGLDAAIGFLARAGKRSGADVAVPVPLLELVARLAQRAADGTELHRWCLDIADRVKDKEFTEANIQTLGYTALTPRQALTEQTLLIAFEPIDCNARRACMANAWLIDGAGNGGNVGKRAEVTPDGFAAFIDDALGHARVQDYQRSAKQRLRIELMLPVALLAEDHDDWLPEGGDSPLSTQYPWVVRPVERSPGLSSARYTAGWSEGWQRCARCRGASRADGCTAWLDAPPSDGFLELLEDDGICLYLLRYRPAEAQLREMLEDGVTMALWAYKPLAQAVCDDLQRQLEAHPLDTLPDTLRRIRHRQWRRARQAPGSARGAGVRLLWDDPARVPRRAGKEDRDGRVPRLRNPMRPT